MPSNFLTSMLQTAGNMAPAAFAGYNNSALIGDQVYFEGSLALLEKPAANASPEQLVKHIEALQTRLRSGSKDESHYKETVERLHEEKDELDDLLEAAQGNVTHLLRTNRHLSSDLKNARQETDRVQRALETSGVEHREHIDKFEKSEEKYETSLKAVTDMWTKADDALTGHNEELEKIKKEYGSSLISVARMWIKTQSVIAGKNEELEKTKQEYGNAIKFVTRMWIKAQSVIASKNEELDILRAERKELERTIRCQQGLIYNGQMQITLASKKHDEEHRELNRIISLLREGGELDSSEAEEKDLVTVSTMSSGSYEGSMRDLKLSVHSSDADMYEELDQEIFGRGSSSSATGSDNQCSIAAMNPVPVEVSVSVIDISEDDSDATQHQAPFLYRSSNHREIFARAREAMLKLQVLGWRGA